MQSIHQSPGVGIIWAISSFTEMVLLEFLPGWILYTSNQSVAAQGTADPPGGVAKGGWDEPLKILQEKYPELLKKIPNSQTEV